MEGKVALNDKIVGVDGKLALFTILRAAWYIDPAPRSTSVHYGRVFYKSRLVQSDLDQSLHDLRSLKHVSNT